MDKVTMGKLGSCLKWFFLWLLSSTIAFLLIVLVLYISGLIWWPTGISDPKLAQVAGDSWAITSDGRFFYQDNGDWKRLNIETSDSAVWGLGFDDDSLVIAAKTEVYYRGLSLPLPTLSEPIVATGKINICMPESYTSNIFVSSPSEIAFYNWSDKSWVVLPFKSRLSIPVVTAGCNFYYAKGKALNVIKVEMPGNYAYSSIGLTEAQKDISRYGEITSITSSHETVWLMTTSNTVLQIEWYEYDPLSWAVLHSPPMLENSHLVAGTLGYTFGGSSVEHVDLWLIGNNHVYWYDREKRDWDVIRIYGRKPLVLSGLTTSSETVGYSVSRLAVVDGILLQQYPLNARRIGWLVLGVPISGIIGIIMVMVMSLFERNKQRITKAS